MCDRVLLIPLFSCLCVGEEEKDTMFDESFANFFTAHGVDPEGAMTLVVELCCSV